MDEERLLEIAEEWARNTIDSWICEYGAWDDLIEDDTLTDEEYDWIKKHVRFNINTENIKSLTIEEQQ